MRDVMKRLARGSYLFLRDGLKATPNFGIMLVGGEVGGESPQAQFDGLSGAVSLKRISDR